MALYEPPANLSPAAMRYLMRMSYDNKIFAAAILDMAVRGYLKITESAGTYTLTVTGASENVLTADEKQIAGEFFDGRTQIILQQENHTVIHAAIVSLKKWLKTAEQRVYFVTNSRYLIPAAILSVFVALAYFLSLGGPQTAGGIFVCVWLTLWTVGVSSMLLNLLAAWHDVLRHGSASLIGWGKAIFLSLFAIPFVAGEAFGLFLLAKFTSISFGIFLIATGILHGVFVHLMKAPTFAGRRLMDQVEGFKLFLGAVDGDRLNRAAPPQQTPQTFEKFLPYALALDVEQDWAEKILRRTLAGRHLDELLRLRLRSLILFRRFLGILHRSSLRLFLWEFARQRDIFFLLCAGFQRWGWRWRLRRRRGWRRRRRLVSGVRAANSIFIGSPRAGR